MLAGRPARQVAGRAKRSALCPVPADSPVVGRSLPARPAERPPLPEQVAPGRLQPPPGRAGEQRGGGRLLFLRLGGPALALKEYL